MLVNFALYLAQLAFTWHLITRLFKYNGRFPLVFLQLHLNLRWKTGNVTETRNTKAISASYTVLYSNALSWKKDEIMNEDVSLHGSLKFRNRFAKNINKAVLIFCFHH